MQAKRQQRKLNFLITQTELYAHFMARKLTGATEETKQKILNQLVEIKAPPEVEGRVLGDVIPDDYGMLWLLVFYCVHYAGVVSRVTLGYACMKHFAQNITL